ncbi:ABC transporter substrate-binding protein [Pseudochrobactrum asaccharolyticum]|uniref:ABC transporter substrate-binding protein n=1 Tax=Pseudochrobactrum asaccharolyticum TaxID=354351 RepID=UPI00404184DB
MMKNRTKLLLATGIASLVLLSPALADQMLRLAITGDPRTIDVQMTTDEYTIPLNVYDRLVEAETIAPGQSKILPSLAESWDISEDGKTYTLHLRKGVLFHNGEELTADDVVYTYDRMLNPATKALNTDILDFVEGAKARLDGTAPTVTGLQAVDKYTVKIVLTQPYAAFIALLASPQASIYNRKFTEPLGDKYGLSPDTVNGTGPFVLTDYTLNDSQRMEANEKYFKGRSKLDSVLIRVVPDAETMRMLFESDEIDVFDTDSAITQIPYFTKSEKWKDQIRKGPVAGLNYYHINQKIKPFDDVRVRKAFQMGINRQEILDKMFYGEGQLENGILPSGVACYTPATPIEYNPKKAKELLVEAGYPDGVDIAFSQVSSWSSKWVDLNQLVQAQLRESGFNTEIKVVDESAYYDMRKGGTINNYPQVWSADFNDPDNFFYTFFSKSGTSVRGFNNEDQEVFDGIEKARGMTNPDERCKLYEQLTERIVQTDAAWVPLFSLNHLFIVQPRVKNFVVPWNGWTSMSYYKMEVEE